MENDKQHFTRSVLPWLVAAGALLVYLVTLNPWLTLSSLPQVVRVGGWDWQPNVYAPFYSLLTYPFRWLPIPWLPVALNCFTAVCAALTLALLARSVALLPHDRTHDQRQREQSEDSLLSISTAWLPPVLAAVACGLQLTFWESATAASNDMFDLLVFAYCVRCLLEHRLDPRRSWMTRFAVVYGAGMANNWAMIGFLPAFLVAVIWIKGLSFFNPRFLFRTGAAGLAGLSLYLLLPLVHGLSGDLPEGIWRTVRFTLAMQKQVLMAFPFSKAAMFLSDKPLWVLALTSMLPVLVMGIRWPSYFGDSSPLGVGLATTLFHLSHGFFLLVCGWLLFDPPFSGRAYGQFNSFYPSFLTLYYLGALSVGYFSGYFLLVFGKTPGQARAGKLIRRLSPAITAAVWALLLTIPLGLVYRNLPQVRTTNGPLLNQYASLLAESLPRRGAVVLSDDPRRLFLLQAALDRSLTSNQHVLLGTYSLQFPAYHRYLERKHPGLCSQPALTNQATVVIGSPALIQFLTELASDHQIYYLHPSFGYYFEQFYLRPHGVVCELKVYPTNSITAPPLAANELAENQDFWKRSDGEVLSPLSSLIAPPTPAEKGLGEKLLQTLHASRENNAHARVLGTFYSRALNYCGVELQRVGRLNEAGWYFTRALALNPDNVVARVNGQCNQNLRAGKPASIELSKSVEDQFGKYRSWVQVTSENGPFDEPNFCYEQGRVYAKGGLYRQAAQQFDRVRKLAPNHLPARLALAYLFSVWQLPEKVLELTDEICSSPALQPSNPNQTIELAYLEASAHFAKENPRQAEQVLQSAIEKLPDDENLLTAATQVYLVNGRYSNALPVIEKHLQLAPDNPSALINKGFVCIQLNACDAAIASLSRLLSMQTNNFDALFNRAVAYIRSGNLDAARRDYETLQKVFPTAHQIDYGLGEIAYRKKDTAAAIRHYQLYMAHSPTNIDERKFVAARLAELESSPP